MGAISIVVNAIGWTLIHSLWLGALAAAAYALPAARLRNQAPQLAYGWGLCCLFVLVVALGLIFSHEFHRLWISADAQAIAHAYAALPVASGTAVSAMLPEPAQLTITSWIERLLPMLVLAWALAVAVIGSGLVRSQLALRRLVAAGVSLPQLAQPIASLALHFGVNRPIAVISSMVARVPFVIGHFAPVIVLPLSVATGMPWPQLRLILAHEIAHLRRADYLINWLQIALEVLLFFHPAVRWLSEELRRLREACCDDLVVAFAGGRSDYTRALLSLEESRNEAPLLAPSAVAGGLLWRVQRIAGRAPSHRGALQRVVLPAVIVSLLVLTLAGGVQIRPGYGPRDLVLPQAVLLTPSLLQRETLQVSFDWQVQLPPVADAEVGSEPMALTAAAPTYGIGMIKPELDQSTLPPLTMPELIADIRPIAAAVTEQAPAVMPMQAESLKPVQSVPPVFPNGERLIDETLTVELDFALTADGKVRDIRAINTPAQSSAFVLAATKALSQWSYSPAAVPAEQRLRHRFVFRDQGSEGQGECTMLTASRLCLVDARPGRRDAVVPGERCKATTGSRLCRR